MGVPVGANVCSGEGDASAEPRTSTSTFWPNRPTPSLVMRVTFCGPASEGTHTTVVPVADCRLPFSACHVGWSMASLGRMRLTVAVLMKSRIAGHRLATSDSAEPSETVRPPRP